MRSESQPHTGRFHFPFWGLNADPERDHVKLPACHRKEDTSDRLLREERQLKEYFRTVTPREIEAPWHLTAHVGKKLSRDCPDFHNHPDHDATWPIMSCVGRRSTCLPWTSWWQRSAGGQLCARPSGGSFGNVLQVQRLHKPQRAVLLSPPVCTCRYKARDTSRKCELDPTPQPHLGSSLPSKRWVGSLRQLLQNLPHSTHTHSNKVLAHFICWSILERWMERTDRKA